jgi:tetratricopeptide (TPR) repeat protein
MSINPARSSTAFLCSTLLVLACSRQEPPSPVLVNLPGEIGYHLQNSDDSTLAKYARSVGVEETSFALHELYQRRGRMSAGEHARYDEDSIRYSGRLCDVLASEFCMGERRFWEFYRDLPRESRHEFSQLTVQQHDDAIDIRLSYEEKIAKGREYLSIHEGLGNLAGIALSKYNLAQFYFGAGNEREYDRYLRMSLDDYQRLGNSKMVCQILGAIGARYRVNGEVDSMRIYYDRAREIALRCRLAEQAARIESLYAAFYRAQGRLGLSIQFLEKAIQTAQDLEGGVAQERFLVDAMLTYADLGAWRAVDKLMARADLLTKQHPKIAAYRGSRLLLGPIDARLRLAHGDLPGAERVWHELKPAMHASHKGRYLQMIYDWAEGLLTNGRLDDATALIREGLQFSDTTKVYDWHARLCLRLCEAKLSMGDIGEAQEALEGFSAAADHVNRALEAENLQRNVLQYRIDLVRGDTDRAQETFLATLARLEDCVGQMDASTYGYLWISELTDLRELVHESTRGDPRLGYGAEFYWKDLYALLGQDERGGRSLRLSAGDAAAQNRDVESLFLARAEPALQRLSGFDATHLMYATAGDSVLRWTARGETVRCDALGMTAGRLRALADETWRVLETESDPGNPDLRVSDRLAGLLSKLGDTLLPPGLPIGSDGSEKPLLFVTSGDFLGRIPFEAIDIDATERYEPLLSACDVAYVRDLQPMGAEVPVSSTLVLADPTPPTGLYRPADLPDGKQEADVFARTFGGKQCLSGRDATKANLESGWENASVLYFVTHVVRDPEVSFIAYIPLSPDAEASDEEATQLDIVDIRRADLSGCALVVLSGCSSGVPYLDAGNCGPSLADAFLDAGAAAVVQTFCDVEDKEAGMFMGRAASELDGTVSTISTIRALSRARRQAMTGPNGVRHPFRWTSYAIKISRI